MALSSESDFGLSGAAGFALGTVEKNPKTKHKTKAQRVSLRKSLHALNYNDLFLCISADYFLLSFDISFIRGRLSLHVLKVSQKWR